MILW
jgi:hypothetical protein